MEISNTLQPRAWGYNKADDGKYRHTEAAMKMIQNAWEITYFSATG